MPIQARKSEISQAQRVKWYLEHGSRDKLSNMAYQTKQ